jgi:hypothetical protein
LIVHAVNRYNFGNVKGDLIMKHTAIALTCVILVMGAGTFGCARAARDTSGFALREEGVLKASFEDSWHAVKRVLREQGYDVYTRDKRGAFVAYTPMKRVLWTQPRRTKFTIELAQTSPEETAIAIESVRQVYGVTLLTHPNWHDRKQTDPAPSQALLEGIQAKIVEGLETEAFEDAASAAPEAAKEGAAAPALETQPLPPAEEVAVEEAATVK